MSSPKSEEPVQIISKLPNHEASGRGSDSKQALNVRNIARMTSTRLSRQRYTGSLFFNFFAFLLPALYGTLSKLWVAQIDASAVVTTDIYTYIGVIVEVLNEGIPRSAFLVIGDRSTRSLRSRLGLSYTLITVQILLGAIMTVVFLSSSKHLAGAFVPKDVRDSSLTYVRISSVSALSSAMEVAVSSCTRALDHPDVPLLISSIKFAANIVLDLIIISKFHVHSVNPTVNTQAIIRLVCDLSSATCGLLYFIFITVKMQRQSDELAGSKGISLRALRVLIRPSIYTFIESALRNALYLWLVSGIISMSADYATAWGVFNTIRWGLVMVPVQALEASTLTFVGHRWGQWRARLGPEIRKPKASWRDLQMIVRPAMVSSVIALIVEVPVCLFLSLWGIEGFAYYLSLSASVAHITQIMWKTIDWCYIFYALNYQLSAILLATTPRWFLYQALGSNLLWVLPWAIIVGQINLTVNDAWKYHSIIFGGSLVFSFGIVVLVIGFWAWMLRRGNVRMARVAKDI